MLTMEPLLWSFKTLTACLCLAICFLRVLLVSYTLTVSTRDLVDHTCLYILRHSVLYPHQSLADHMNRFEDGLDPLRLEGPTGHFKINLRPFTYGSTGSFPCQGPVQLIVNAFEGVLWQNFISKEARSTCLLLLHVATPLMLTACDIISGHAHKQLSCIKPLPWGISVQ